MAAAPSVDAIRSALAGVEDPEIHKPITELGMVKDINVLDHGKVEVAVYLTVAGCPMKDTITQRVTIAVSAVSGVTAVSVELDVMNDEQRRELRKTVRGDSDEPVIPFAQPGSMTRVYAVASGKGGVGKSSVTVNLAAAMADKGLSVGVVDADIYGHSVPRMLGTDEKPTKVDDMIMPPQSHGVKLISIGMFTPGNTPVVWRGPMLHRALQQFLADVFWGDLDILLLDLPPGTGDIAISVAQLIPNAELLVVTTPQQAASEVAERAGVEAPRTVSPSSYDELEALAERLRFPCLVKPAESFRYNRAFGVKMKRVHTPDELRTAWGEAHELGIGTMVQELIPGPETGGVNYNVYVVDGVPRAEMTSCKLRLSPRDFGYPSAVVSRHVPEVIAPGRAIVAAMGIEGFANVEFKQDERDGRYQLMEVNGRPNMSGRLAVRCGVDFPLLTYRHLVHGEVPVAPSWREGVHWVNEFKDTRILLDRWRDGRLPWFGGLRPYVSTGVFATFDPRDPRPFLARVRDRVGTEKTPVPAPAR